MVDQGTFDDDYFFGAARRTSKASERVNAIVSSIMEDMKAPYVPPHLSNVLARGLPAADSRLVESFLDVADGGEACRRIWRALGPSFTLAEEKRKSMVLVTGTSGVGKSKTASDIGRKHALVVQVPAVRQDDWTPPYKSLVKKLGKLSKAANEDQGQLADLQDQALGMYGHLLASYLEWVVRVLKKAEAEGCRREQMQELAMRAQDMTRYEKNVKDIFKTSLTCYDCSRSGAEERVEQLVADCPLKLPIVFCHDEVQALLDNAPALENFFAGAFGRHFPSDVPAATTPAGRIGKPSASLFYGFAMVVRGLLSVAGVGHMLCGTNLRLTEEMFNRYSPAQGVTTHVALTTNLSAKQITRWYGTYLTPEARQGLDTGLIRKLCGRPLFASKFWHHLLHANGDTSTAAAVVEAALEDAYEDTRNAAVARVDNLWDAPKASQLLPSLYCSLKLGFGTAIKYRTPSASEVGDAILRGVLNVDAKTVSVGGIIDLEHEPATAEAVLTVGDIVTSTRLWEFDPAVKLFANCCDGYMVMDSSKGEQFEELFAWHVLKFCTTKQRPVSLRELLQDFVDEACWPVDIDDLYVDATWGLRCNWVAGDMLSLLVKFGDSVLLHYTPTDSKCADIVLLAFRVNDQGEHVQHRVVLIQSKNQKGSIIPAAMASLDMGEWYPPHSSNPDAETAAHAAFRRTFAGHPNWFKNPIRIVFHRKKFDQLILADVAYLNAITIPEQPILLATAPSWFLAHSRPDGDVGNIGRVQNLWCFLPKPVRHWDKRKHGNHPQTYLSEKEIPDKGDIPKLSRVLEVQGSAMGRSASALEELQHIVNVNRIDYTPECAGKKLTLTFGNVSDALRWRACLQEQFRTLSISMST